MAYNKWLNLQKPTEPYDATTKDYVDYVAETLKESLNNTINKRSYIIAVHANYYGILVKDKFQFTFGGNTIQPQSGRIKKISLQAYGYRFYYKDSKDFLDQLGFSSGTPVPIFTIVLIRNNGEISDLTTYKCAFKFDGSVEVSGGIISECIFTPDPKNVSISEGDILNIRTEVNNIPNAPTIFTIRTNPNFNIDETKNDFFTYLVTFLIELDPL